MSDRSIEPVGLAELFDRSRVVFVLAAPTPDNHHLVSRDKMERLAPDQSLVILSRGHLVDFEALAELTAARRRRVVDDLKALAAGRRPSALQYLTASNLAGQNQRPRR
jgi:phosphoglycerate dehydrogenase-like enzyme